MERANKRTRTTETNDTSLRAVNQASPSLLAELVARVSQLEETQGQVLELQTRVGTLEARVAGLEGELIRAEDRDFAVGRGVSKTIMAIRDGETSIVAERLRRGADPNHDDGLGGTCLIHSVNGGRPECTRLLMDHGANVSYCFPADNASVLYMLVRSFEDRPEGAYRPGDYILNADLLVEAGAPIDEIQDEARTAMSVLLDIEVQEGTRRYRERQGLMSVLTKDYWQEYEHNPFLRAPSPDAAAWLLLKGAANSDTTGRVDVTRVRCIRPDMRSNVLNSLLLYQGIRETFVQILLTMKQNGESRSPFCALRGHESTILPLIASFAGSRGWSLRYLQEAKRVLKDVEERFNEDRRPDDDDALYGEVDDGDADDDSYEVDDEEEDGDEENSSDEDGRDIGLSDEGDY